MKKILLGVCMLIVGFSQISAQENIAAARAMGVGATVTITGIVTNDDELGLIRYVQDATAGVAVYSAELSATVRGDEVTLTGVIKEYNNLLEIDPVSVATINSSGNELPTPIELTPSQFAEEYEGMLVKVLNVDFDATGSFERKSYTFTAGEESGQMYVNDATSPLVGAVIPSNEVTLVGPLGAYGDVYQLLPRDQFDLLSSSVINMTSVPIMSNLTTSGFTVEWTTDVDGTTEAFYGNTLALELGKISEAGTATMHQINLTGLDASELIYFQPFSVKDQDTTRAGVQVYITQSLSSGDMKAYFNREVDPSVSLGILEAGYLYQAIDDTLIKYIDRADETIDFTIYSFNNYNISNISDALNAAYDRGVVVRVIYDGNVNGTGIASLNAAIGRIASPKSEYPIYGIMHNKFVVFDANSVDPNKAIVWTGATNFTDGQINRDPNNVIIVQDQSLAKAYQLEFNEMFGSDGAQPDAGESKFGSVKTNNTPHEFIINGKRVECYFSPSDGTHTQILNTIETADYSIHVATMLITKTDIGYDLKDKNEAGVDVKVLLNNYDQYGEPIVNTLKGSLGEDVRVKGESGIMHHKYMIVDQAEAGSDPMVFTGSHNWSAAAQFRNDENTLIIHDQGVANAYYQDFVKRFSYGQLVVPKPECKNDFVTMGGGSSYRYDVLYNDVIPGAVTLTISGQPTHGTAQVETDKTITYLPEGSFNKDIDTVAYKVCLDETPGICDSALFVIYVDRPVGIDQGSMDELISVYPNPAKDLINISTTTGYPMQSLSIVNLIGQEVLRREYDGIDRVQLNVGAIKQGIYFIKIDTELGTLVKKMVFED